MTDNKLTIQNEMRAIDTKDRFFYDSLTEEEVKKFSIFLMIRWSSAVHGIPEMQEYYLHATNQRLNKNFFDLYDHPKLQWLCATTISPDMGLQNHKWIGNKKKDSSMSKQIKKLKDEFPTAKEEDLATIIEINNRLSSNS